MLTMPFTGREPDPPSRGLRAPGNAPMLRRMNTDVLIAWLHYLAFMVLFAALTAEHLLTKKPLTAPELRRVVILDAVAGISFVLVVVTGVLKLLHYGKGMGYYMKIGWFHAKLTLVVLVFLVSLYPTFTFMRTRSRAGELPTGETIDLPNGVRHALRLQLLLVVLIPLFAAAVARGAGQFE
jgi:putative membrane protein